MRVVIAQPTGLDVPVENNFNDVCFLRKWGAEPTDIQSDKGIRWIERVLSLKQTCKQVSRLL
jgi:hypothetical protein